MDTTYKTQSFEQIAKSVRKPTKKEAYLKSGKKSNDARFNLGKEVIEKMNKLEKIHKVSKGNILKIALTKLLRKKGSMSKDEFISCMYLENLRLTINYTNINYKSKKKLQVAVSRIKLKRSLK